MASTGKSEKNMLVAGYKYLEPENLEREKQF